MDDTPPKVDPDIDAAVHATELSQKAGGSIVVPQDDALPKLSPADVRIEGVDPSKPRLELLFQTKQLIGLAIFIAIFVFAWCGFFMLPRSVVTYYYDARSYTIDEVVNDAKDYDLWLSVVRTILSNGVGDALGPIMAAAYAPVQILSNGKVPLLLRGLTYLVPYAIGLPLSGFDAQIQSLMYFVAIGPEDLGKYDMLVSSDLDATGLDNSAPFDSGGSFTSSFGSSEILFNETQANISADAVRSSTSDTILRRAMLPPRNQVRSCSISNGQEGNEYTNVAYDFMTNDWQLYVLPEAIDPVNTYVVSGSAAASSAASSSSLSAAEIIRAQSLFTRAAFLYADAVMFADSIQDAAYSDALDQLKLDTIAYAEANATTEPDTSDLETFVRNYFDTLAAWQEVLNVTVADIEVEYSLFDITDHIQFTSITLTIPLNNTIWHRELAEVSGELVEQASNWPGSGDVVYEIDVSNECGPRSCGVQNRGLAPEPKIVAYGDCSANGGLDCSGETKFTSMWLAGFGRRIEGDALELLESSDPKLRKAVLRNPREVHQVTMGYLTFVVEDLAAVYEAECRAASCSGLHFPFNDTIFAQSSVLLVGFTNTPMIDFGSSFDILNNHARGRLLVTRYTTGARVDYEILQPKNFDSYNWTEALKSTNCSGRMERSIITNNLNHLFIEDTLQTTYTAGLFFLFQDARAAELDTFWDGSPFLQLLGSDKYYSVALVVPEWQGYFGIIFGSLLLLHLIWLFATQEKQLKRFGSIQDPKVIVRTLADSSAFPDTFIDVKATLPAENGKTVLLRKVDICSVKFGPIPPEIGLSIDTIVIEHDKAPKKELTS